MVAYFCIDSRWAHSCKASTFRRRCKTSFSAGPHEKCVFFSQIPDPSCFLLQSLSATQSFWGSNSFELSMLLPQIFKNWNKQRYEWISWIWSWPQRSSCDCQCSRGSRRPNLMLEIWFVFRQIIHGCLSTRNKYIQCGVPAQVHFVGSASACVFCLLPDSLLNTESQKWHFRRVVEDSELFRGPCQGLVLLTKFVPHRLQFCCFRPFAGLSTQYTICPKKWSISTNPT